MSREYTYGNRKRTRQPPVGKTKPEELDRQRLANDKSINWVANHARQVKHGRPWTYSNKVSKLEQLICLTLAASTLGKYAVDASERINDPTAIPSSLERSAGATNSTGHSIRVRT